MAEKSFKEEFGFTLRLGSSATLEMLLVNTKLIEIANPYHEASKELDELLGKYYVGEFPLADFQTAVKDHERIGELQDQMLEIETAWYAAFSLAEKAFGNTVQGLTTNINNAKPKTSASATA